MTEKLTGIGGVPVLFVMVFCLWTVPVSGQDALTLLFYNTENFFDPFDDSLTLDDAYTPEGIIAGPLSVSGKNPTGCTSCLWLPAIIFPGGIRLR